MDKDLFPELKANNPHLKDMFIPLAERIRPEKWEDFVGQSDLVAAGKPFRELLDRESNFSFILWGPPGTGKTTIARIIARLTGKRFYEISAVNSGVTEIRKIVKLTEKTLRLSEGPAIIFIDEIHRFNKVQQDTILPYLEKGVLKLIGATTENPSIEIIPALSSRCQIFRLSHLSPQEVRIILEKGVKDIKFGLGRNLNEIKSDALDFIVSYSNGDARRGLNILDSAFSFAHSMEKKVVTKIDVEEIVQNTALIWDKNGSEHYDHASAFQKSLRGSDPQAGIYWLAKMIACGEDPIFIARRLLVTAAEDVGLADPQALVIANAAFNAVEKLGLPEARIPLAQAVIYLARAPKSNIVISAIDNALDDIRKKGLVYPVPNHLKDTHYRDAGKKYGFGSEYKYPHDYPGNWINQEYLPKELRDKKYVSDESDE